MLEHSAEGTKGHHIGPADGLLLSEIQKSDFFKCTTTQ